jgi:hypothetical protein
MSTANPYAPPEARVDDVSDAPSEAEAIRREFIKHEASVRSIGILYYIGGVIMILGTLGFLVAGLGAPSEMPVGGAGLAIFVVVYGALGVLSLFLGRGIRQLKSWARTTATVLAVIGLIGFPIGTLINGYILYLLLSAKGKRIFAPDYAAIVAATPFVKYRTSTVVWVLIGLVVLFVVALLVVAAAGR